MHKFWHSARTASAFALLTACLTATAGSAIRPAGHSYQTSDSSPEVVIKAVSFSSAENLIDPSARPWESAPETTVPLFAQKLLPPTGGGSTTAVSVKAAKTPQGVILRLEWTDPTRDDGTSDSSFRDGAAVQFPTGSNSTSKTIAMGHSSNPVDIWHWSAEGPAQKTPRTKKQQFRQLSASEPNVVALLESNRLSKVTEKSPRRTIQADAFKELVATGVYSQQMKPTEFQRLRGVAHWKAGRWQVTIFRPFAQPADVGPDFDRVRLPIAFAIWSGSEGERLGIKSISNWAALDLPQN